MTDVGSLVSATKAGVQVSIRSKKAAIKIRLVQVSDTSKMHQKLLLVTKKKLLKPLVLFRLNSCRTNKVCRFYLPFVLNCFEAATYINQVIETPCF
jgi:hypothetical protein